MGFTAAALSAYILLLSSLLSVSNAAYAITGATGGVQPRLEIRQLYKQRPSQWNLYLLALQQFQGNKQDFITSWFQIGAIHGAPNVPWDGVNGDGGGVGYCTHGNPLFPIWHRPYIALFEQKLQEAATYVANQFPAGNTRNMYLAQAKTLRAPFWDWAAAPPNGNPTLPLIISQKYATVQSPTGQKTIINPLFRYDFHPTYDAMVAPYGGPWNYWQTTFRYPTKDGGTGVQSQNNLAQSTLDNNRVSQRQSLYNWFTLCPEYNQISNDSPQSSSTSCHISLESLHNNIHVWVGGNNNGHMTVVPVSAWDPTFMLHHIMIDRLFAMWQAIYPNSYIQNTVTQGNTYTIKAGSTVGPNSDLTPFHKDTKGNFWTPSASRNTRTFGYVYPEFANSDGSANAIRGYVNNLYGPNARATAGSSKARRDPDASLSDLVGGVLDLPAAVTTASNGSTYQYIANIQTTRNLLGGSYTIYLFFGNPTTEDPLTWGSDKKMVGSYGVFSGPGMEYMDWATTSTVPLTDALTTSVAGGLLKTLESVFVVPFLQSMLQWRVATSDGKVVDPSDVPDLLISVVSSTMTVPTDPNEFPTWSKFNLLTQITKSKVGGLNVLGDLKLLGKRDLIDV